MVVRMTSGLANKLTAAKVADSPNGNFGKLYRDQILAQRMVSRVVDLSRYPFRVRGSGGRVGEAAVAEEKTNHDNADQRPAEVWRINVIGEPKLSSKNDAVADDKKT